MRTLAVLAGALVVWTLTLLMLYDEPSPTERCDALGGRLVRGGLYHLYCIPQPEEPVP